jgi:hypothetical protein
MLQVSTSCLESVNQPYCSQDSPLRGQSDPALIFPGHACSLGLVEGLGTDTSGFRFENARTLSELTQRRYPVQCLESDDRVSFDRAVSHAPEFATGFK